MTATPPPTGPEGDGAARPIPGGDEGDDGTPSALPEGGEHPAADQGHGAAAPEPPAPGLTTFTIEGRTAPALFVVAWLGILLGAGVTFVGILAPAGLPGGILFLVGLVLLSMGLLGAGGSQAIERRAAGWRAYSGPSPVLTFVAVLPVTALLVVLVGTPLVWLGIDPGGTAAAFVSISMHALAYVLVIRLLVVGTGALSWRDLGVVPPGREAIRDLAWGALLAAPVLFVTGLLAFVLTLFLPIPESPLPPSRDTLGLVLNLMTAAVIASIGEELFFRGFATTAWARLLGRRQALVRGSIFFALVHVLTLGGTDAFQAFGLAAFAFVVRLPISFVLGWLFLQRRTLYAPIALHAVFNGLQVLIAGAAV